MLSCCRDDGDDENDGNHYAVVTIKTETECDHQEEPEEANTAK